MIISQPDFNQPLLQNYPTLKDAVAMIMEVVQADHQLDDLPDHPGSILPMQRIQETAPTLLSLIKQEHGRGVPQILTTYIERYLTDIAWDTYRKLPQEEKNALANALISRRPPE